MRSKKWTAIVVACAMVLVPAMFAGCSNQADNGPGASPESVESTAPAETPAPTGGEGLVPEEGAALKVWETEDDGSGAWIQALGEAFTEEYGVPITYEPVNHTDSSDRIATDGPAGVGADVFCAVNDHLGPLVTGGFVYPNDMTDPADYMDAAIQACSYNGTLYGYPTSIETYALVYNTDLIDAPPATWDELITLAQENTDMDAQQYGFLIEPGNFYFLYPFIRGYGGYVFGNGGADPDDIGLNNAGAVQGVELIRTIKTLAPMNSGDITYDIKEGLFNEGKLAMHIMGPWALEGYRQAGVNVAVAPLPTLPNGDHPITFSGVRALYVSSYSKYPNAAKLFAMYCTTKEALLQRFTSIGQIPPRLDIMDDPVIADDPDMHAFLTQAQYSEPMPSIPEMGAVWDVMKAAVCTVWDDENADVQETLDNAVQQIRDANAVTTE